MLKLDTSGVKPSLLISSNICAHQAAAGQEQQEQQQQKKQQQQSKQKEVEVAVIPTCFNYVRCEFDRIEWPIFRSVLQAA